MSSAGQALGGIVGGIIGFFVGGGPQGALYGAQIGMGIGGAIDPPKGPNIQGPRLSDLSVQTSTYGVGIPRIYGTIGTPGNIIWLENNQLKEVRRKSSSGGKGGGGGATTTTYAYFATFAVGLADTTKTGPIAGVRRIWAGANLIYDAGSDDIDTVIASNQAAKGFSVYTGDEDQLPDPRMQADLGVNNCPAYRGLAYIVFYDFALEKYSNSLVAAQIKVEVINQKTDLPASLSQSLDSEITRPTVQEMQIYRLGNDGIACGVAYNANVVLGVPQDHLAAIYTSSSLARINQTVFTDMLRRLWTPAGQYMSAYPWHVTGLYSNGRPIGTSPPHDYWYNGTVYKNTGVFYNYILHWTVLGGYLYIHDYVADELVMCSPEGRVSVLSVPNDMQIAVVNGRFIGVSRVDIAEAWIIDPSGLSIISTSPCTINSQIGTTPGLLIGTDKPCILELSNATPTTKRLHELAEDGSEIVHTYTLPSPTNTMAACVVDGICTMADLYDPSGGAGLARGVRIRRYILEAVEAGVAKLEDIIESECLQSGILETSDLDVSEIDQEVRGYRVTETSSIRAALEPLRGAWPFDVVQRGYKITFIPRGKSSVATIDSGELDARAYSDAQGVQLELSNEMDTQLPRRVNVRYLDTSREYDINEQSAERINTDSVNIRDIELPVVLNANEAAGMGEVLLYLYWLERRDVKFRLPPEYRYLEPSDVITITGELGQYELRLTRVALMPDGRLSCDAKYNSAAIYTPTAEGEEGEIPSGVIGVDGPTYYTLIDGPCISDAYNTPGYAVAACGYTTGWPGGIVFRTADGGGTWNDLVGFPSPVTIAIARDSIGAGRVDIPDEANVLQVDVLAGELESVSYESLLNATNLVAYGADGRWEVMAFRSAELQADGSYILSGFLRGRFGTEWAMDLHETGDEVVLLTDADLGAVNTSADLIGSEFGYRGITNNRGIDTDTTRQFTYQGVNLEPLSPVYLNGSRHPSTRDWTLTWIRRGRVSAGWRNFVDVPIGEAAESYEVDIYSDGTYTTVVRTLSSSSQSVSYTSAQQVADFGSNQATLYVKVYQLSETVGRGYALTDSITRG